MAGSRERERRRARERFEQQRSAHRERQRKNRKRAGIGLAVLCVLGLIAGVTTALVSGGGNATAASKKPTTKVSATASPSASATSSASAAAVTEPATHCTYTSASAGSVVKSSLPTASPDYKAAYTASINTNLGPIKIDLANSKATCTVNSFAHLASDNFWNSTQCHRMSNSGGLYMLQCGDPTAKASQKLSCSSANVGTGGPGYEFASENLTGAGYVPGWDGGDGQHRFGGHQRKPVLPCLQADVPGAGLHAVRDDYLGAGYPPECGQSRHYVYFRLAVASRRTRSSSTA